MWCKARSYKEKYYCVMGGGRDRMSKACDCVGKGGSNQIISGWTKNQSLG